VKSADIRRYIFNKKCKKERNRKEIQSMHFDINIHCSNALPLTCKNVIHTHTTIIVYLIKEKVFTPYFYLSQQKSKKEFYYNFVFFFSSEGIIPL